MKSETNTEIRYVMVKAVATYFGTRETSAMHLSRMARWGGYDRVTVCGKRAVRRVGGAWEPREASCRECKRIAGVG